MNSNSYLKEGMTVGGRYRIKSALGKGGSGNVYIASDKSQPRKMVALKLLASAEPAWIKLFEKEFSLLSMASHPNIVEVHDYGWDENTQSPFFTAKLLEGTPLTKIENPLPEEELAEILVQVCRAFLFLHARHITHGDIKKANVIRLDSPKRYVLIDFGLAQSFRSGDSSGYAGTPHYIAPERAQGKTGDGRSDLFSLGVMLYSLATGKYPYPPLLPGQEITARPDLLPIRKNNSNITKEFEDVILRLLAWNPSARFQNALQVIQALNRSTKHSVPIETAETIRATRSTPKIIGREKMMEDILERIAPKRKKTKGIHENLSIYLSGPEGIGKTSLQQKLERELQFRGIQTLDFSCKAPGLNSFHILHSIEAASRGERKRKKAVPMSEANSEADQLEKFAKKIVENAHRLSKPLAVFVDDFDALSNQDQYQILGLVETRQIKNADKLHFIFSGQNLSSEMKSGKMFYELALPPLNRKQTKEYLEIYNRNIHPTALNEALSKSGGVPLLLEEIVNELLPNLDQLSSSDAQKTIRSLSLGGEAKDRFQKKFENLSLNAKDILKIMSLAKFAIPFKAFPQIQPSFEEENFRLAIQELQKSGFIETSQVTGDWAVRPSNELIATTIQKGLNKNEAKGLHDRLAHALTHSPMNFGPEETEKKRHIAFHLLQSSAPEKSKSFLEDALRELRNLGATRDATDLLEHLQSGESKSWVTNDIRDLSADIYFRAGRYMECLGLLDELQDSDQDLNVDIALRKIDVLLRKRNFSEITKLLPATEKRILDLNDKKLQNEKLAKLRSLEQLSALWASDFDQVEKLGKELEGFHQALPLRDRLRAITLQGHASREQRKRKDAEAYYLHALKVAEDEGTPVSPSMAWGGLALLYQQEKKFDASADAFRKAVASAEKTSDTLALSTHKLNLGYLMEEEGRYGEALHLYRQGLQLFHRLGNTGAISRTLYRLESLRQFIRSTSSKNESWLEALSLAEKSGDRRLQAYCRLYLVRMSTPGIDAKKEWKNARDYFSKAKDLEGVHECDLISFEKGWGDSPPPIDQLDLDQIFRLVHTYLRIPVLEKKASMVLNRELEKKVSASRNPEWRMQFYRYQALLARNRRQPSRSREASAIALEILEELSASLDEALQKEYLDSRNYRELEELARGEFRVKQEYI